jgi:FkbM family methyltransferase
VECGGGLGIVACLANRRLQQPTQHLVVEANPALLPVLSRHAELKGCRFEVVQAAIGYERPTTEFFVCGNRLPSSRERRTPRPIKVSTVTLGSLLERYERANVICDIEGTEIELIEHEHAPWSKVQTLILEVLEELVGAKRIRAALTKLQKRHGFTIAAVHGEVAVLTARLRA